MSNEQTSPDKEVRRCKSCGKQLKGGGWWSQDWLFCDFCARDLRDKAIKGIGAVGAAVGGVKGLMVIARKALLKF